MHSNKLILFVLLVVCCKTSIFAQLSKSVSDIELQHKECLRINPDSSGCSRIYLAQLDSLQLIVVETLNKQLNSDEKSSFINDQISWSKKKAVFFKKLDETFVYNLQEGIWKKDMIRITYEQKAEYLLKRIKVLLKKVHE